MSHLVTTILLLTHVVGVGVPLAGRVARRLRLPVATQAGLSLVAGLATLGLFILLLGHLGLLSRLVAPLAAAVGLVCAAFSRATVGPDLRCMHKGLVTQLRSAPWVSGAVALALLIALAATLRPPGTPAWDELEYHWPAPLEWAQSGHWHESSYRHVDGFPFMQVIYTAAAPTESYVAAHVLHFTSFLAIGLLAAGIARSVGIQNIVYAASAALVMRVSWQQSYFSYNDVGLAAFAVAATAVIIAARSSPSAGTLTSGTLSAVSTSIKPVGMASAGVVGLIYALRGRWLGGEGPRRVSELTKGWLLIALPVALAVAFWGFRRWVLTGVAFDSCLFEACYTGGELNEVAAETTESRMLAGGQRVYAPFFRLSCPIRGFGSDRVM